MASQRPGDSTGIRRIKGGLALWFLLGLVLLTALGFHLRYQNSPTVPRPQTPLGAGYASWLEKAQEAFPSPPSGAPLVFPADHRPHENAPTEVWEFAGSLHDAQGRRYAFRFSFGRFSFTREAPSRSSAWAFRDAYRGEFSLVSDAGWFRGAERYARAALDMGGYDPKTAKLWIDDWKVELDSAGNGPFRLAASLGDAGMDVRLKPMKPTLEPTGAGSVGGDGAGATRYYLLPRLEVSGSLVQAGETRPVTGQAWLNRSWGRLLPPGGQTLMSRLQIQLNDGRELFLTHLRRRDGSAAPVAAGLLIDAAGRGRWLEGRDIRLEASGEISHEGRRYPARWSLQLPGWNGELQVTPWVEDQVVGGSMPAWTGVADVRGPARDGDAPTGIAFVNAAGG